MSLCKLPLRGALIWLLAFIFLASAAHARGFSDTQLKFIKINPANGSVAAGRSQQFTVQATYTLGSTKTITSGVKWEILSSTAPVTITSGGKATTKVPGHALIRATFNKNTATVTLTITDPVLDSITISPTKASVAAGNTQGFIVTGNYSNGPKNITSTAKLTALPSTVVESISGGLVKTKAQGSTNITASFGGKSVAASLSITAPTLSSITLSPSKVSIQAGQTKQFTATGNYTNGAQDLSKKVTWASSQTSTATIDKNGLVTSSASGSTNISAGFGGKSASTPLTVTEPTLVSIIISPDDASVAAGLQQQYTATGAYSDGSSHTISATWFTGNSSTATIASNGLATALAIGSTSITARFGGKSASVTLKVTEATLKSITLSPDNVSITVGRQQPYQATGIYSDGSSRNISATWSTGNSSTATITSNGLATALATGSTSIKASFGGKSTSVTLNVTAATLNSITLSPDGASVAAGLQQQYTATGAYSDGSSHTISATWSTGNSSTATIASNGLATALATGSTSITASFGGKSASVTLNVTEATLKSITLSPDGSAIVAGLQQQYTATGIYSDGSSHNISSQTTWTLGDSSITSIDSNGLAHALKKGSTSITAAFGGKSASVTINVTDATLKSITLSPDAASIAAGLQQQYVAIGVYSDGTTNNISTQVNWSSGNENIASITSNGLATTHNSGATSITASFGGKTASVPLTVTTATLSSITISPQNASVAAGIQQAYIATGIYSDGTSHNISSQVTWSSGDTSIAIMDSSGAATGRTPGSTSIIATLGAQSANVPITITDATLSSITITPNGGSIASGLTQQYVATGVYSNGSSHDISDQVSWSSGDPAIVSVATNGLATAHASGNTSIIATYNGNGQTTSVPLNVTAATIESITLTPSNASVAAGVSQQYIATAVYSDESTQDVST